MKKVSYLFIFLTLYGVCSIEASGFLTEIINNTDEDIILNFMDTNNKSPKNFILLYSENIKTGEKLGLVNMDGNLAKSYFGNLKLPKKTRNIIKDLEIPIVSGSYPNLGLNQTYHNSISLRHELPVSNETKPLPFVGMRQKGDLLEVITIPHCSGIQNIDFDNQLSCDISGGPSHLVMSENILTGSSYSIEIVQLKKIRYRLFATKVRRKLVDSTFNIIIRKNNILNTSLQIPFNEIKTQPKAYISTFKAESINDGITSIEIKFDSPCTIEFYKNFKIFIQKNFRPNVIVDTNDIQNQTGEKSVSIKFTLYTMITKEDFQRILNTANSILSIGS